jgi:hypothetical protein
MRFASVVPISVKLPAITSREGSGPAPSGSHCVAHRTSPLAPGTPSPGSSCSGHCASSGASDANTIAIGKNERRGIEGMGEL